MDRRLKKQLIYAVSFFVFLAIVIGGFYFVYLKPAPSCFDGIQNQKEEGIDCGGPCANACMPQLNKLVLADRILILRPDATHISFLTRVSNPNFNYAAKSFSYSFDLLNASGSVVQSFPGNSFIYAGEIKYILVPNVPLPQAQFTNVDLRLDENPDWVPAGEFRGPPQFNTTGAQTNVLAKGISVDGNIINLDTMPFAKVTIVAIFIGKLNEVAGASQTEVGNLAPNAPQPFSIIHPPMQNIDVLGTKISAYASRQ